MAAAVVQTSGTGIIKDDDNYNTGATTDVSGFVLYRNSVDTGTSTAFTHNGNTLVQDQSIITAPLLSFDMYLTSGTVKATSDGLLDAEISTTATDEGGLLASVSGMKQSGTVIPTHQLVPFASAALPQLTYTISAGEVLICAYESNGGTLTVPPDASNGNSYDEVADGDMTGSPLTQGKIYTLEATSDMTSESIGWSLTGSNSGTAVLYITSAEAVAAGGYTNALGLMGVG